jgi:hypothetical protein
MTDEDRRTLAALQRLQDWGGLSQIAPILDNLRRRPNLFLIAPRIMNVEGIHSDLLAWMLDPAGWHGLGDRFASAFVRAVLEACGRSTELPINIDDVRAEASTGKGPVDILVRVRIGNVKTILGIENKIWADEGDEQLKRYGDGLASQSPDVVLAFLTPKGRKPTGDLPGCPVASLSYRKVATLLDQALLAASAEAGAGPEIVRQYVSALGTHVMNESNPEIDALCRKLLEDHEEAWRVIRRRLPSRRDDFHASIGAGVCDWLQKEHPGAWQFVVRRDRYACVFREQWFGLGTYETDSLVDFTQGVKPPSSYPCVHFRLVVADDSDSDTEDELQYALKLKVDKRKNPALGEALVTSLKSLDTLRPKIKDRNQFTATLKQSSRLPALGDDATGVPDSVVQWYASHLTPVVPLIDSVF